MNSFVFNMNSFVFNMVATNSYTVKKSVFKVLS